MEEEFKKIKDYENYEVSNLGRIKHNEKFLKGSMNSSGYIQIRLHNENGSCKKYLHRLVMECFIGLSDLDVNHKNHIKTDNYLENLEYVTKSENKIKYNEFHNIIKTNYKKCECGDTIWKTSKMCKKCSFEKRRIVKRPDKLELIELLKTNSFTAVGKMFGVSDNSIRKWIK